MFFNVNGQASKSDPLESLKAKTSKWFKDVYVESNFKDPYSYKLMKCVLYPLTLSEWADESKRELMYRLVGKDTSDRFGEYQNSKKKVEQKRIRYEEVINSSDTTEIKYRKADYNFEMYLANKILKEYTDIKNIENEIETLLKESDDKALNAISYYKVYIDAYGKNSIGNSVLGKYYYMIDKNGVTQGEVKTMD